jgi:uncharacterized protein YjiS (DUF1127 family)
MLLNLENKTVHSPTRRQTKPSSTVTLGATLYRLWTGFHRWNSNRLAIRELQQLEGRMLKDIGLHRSAIEYEVKLHRGWPTDATRTSVSLDSNHSHSAGKGGNRHPRRHH